MEYRGWKCENCGKWKVHIDGTLYELNGREGEGLWTEEREDGRYFSKEVIEGGREWKVVNGK